MAHKHITIIGAGVTGLTIATELSANGIQVDLVDRTPHPGNHSCSWYAGGMLAPFCEGEIAEDLVVELGQEAQGWWRDNIKQVHTNGTLVVAAARDQNELLRYARRTKNHRWLDSDEISKLEPDLAGRFSKALFFPDEAHIDPRKALEDLRANLECNGIEVKAAAPEQATSNHIIVDARGFSAKDKLPDLRGVKGEMVIVASKEIRLQRPVRLLHPRQSVYIVPRGTGTYMIGATQINSEEQSRVSARGMVELLSAAYAVHPAFAEAEIIEIGCDVRPAFPDNLPRIRKHGNTIYVNGLYRHGFLLAPALAKRTAKLILDPNFQMEEIYENNT